MTATFRRSFLILLVALISFAFLWMIRAFLITILLAALFSGVATVSTGGLPAGLAAARRRRRS